MGRGLPLGLPVAQEETDEKASVRSRALKSTEWPCLPVEWQEEYFRNVERWWWGMVWKYSLEEIMTYTKINNRIKGHNKHTVPHHFALQSTR